MCRTSRPAASIGRARALRLLSCGDVKAVSIVSSWAASWSTALSGKLLEGPAPSEQARAVARIRDAATQRAVVGFIPLPSRLREDTVMLGSTLPSQTFVERSLAVIRFSRELGIMVRWMLGLGAVGTIAGSACGGTRPGARHHGIAVRPTGICGARRYGSSHRHGH